MITLSDREARIALEALQRADDDICQQRKYHDDDDEEGIVELESASQRYTALANKISRSMKAAQKEAG